MTKVMYSIKDELTGYIPQIILLDNDEEAIRTLNIIKDDPNSYIAQSPRDYSIWSVGTFDLVTGNVEYINPTLIIRADSLGSRKE